MRKRGGKHAHVRGELPLWMPVFMIVAALSLGLVLSVMLRQDTITTDSAADRAFRSALLPDDWKTYTGGVWSVGYPGDWEVETVTGGVAMYPEGEDAADYYFEIIAADAYTIGSEAFAGEADETSEFLFAGYPAIKYTVNGDVYYYVQYGTRAYVITTRHEDDPQVGIMLATFQFIEKE